MWKMQIKLSTGKRFSDFTEVFSNDRLCLIKKKIIRIEEEILKIVEKKLFWRLLDWNFAVLTEFVTIDQSVRSVRVTQVAIKVLEAARFWSVI